MPLTPPSSVESPYAVVKHAEVVARFGLTPPRILQNNMEKKLDVSFQEISTDPGSKYNKFYVEYFFF